jgi:septal ring factor EnvC (AmiA/AmiB activator)
MKKLMMIFTLCLFGNFYADDFVNQKLNEQNELIDNIEFEIMNMENIISSLKLDNTNLTEYTTKLENGNKVMSEEITSLKENNKELHVALDSNKEDTHEVINILGNMTEEITKAEKQKELTNKFVQIAIPTMALPLVASGAYMYFATDEKDLGKLMMMCGGGLFIGAEITWNGGKFIKIW